MARASTHESFDHKPLPLPSERSTGLVFAGVALVVAFIWRRDPVVWEIALGIAAAFVVIALIVPIILRPLNIAWMKLAELISKVMNPLVMLILYVIVIVPAGLLQQWRADPMRLKKPQGVDSYWVERDPAEVTPMTRQF